MSVIVKGMEMPTSCRECIERRLGFRAYFGCIKGTVAPSSEERLPDCPLRPLPEKHGRLIDAKVFDAAFTALRFNDDGTLRHWDDRKNWCLHGGEVESLIENTETIVEAEGD